MATSLGGPAPSAPGALTAAEPDDAPPRANAFAKRDVRAAEYRRLADAASALAQSSPLFHVREKHERAAERWTALAVLDEQ